VQRIGIHAAGRYANPYTGCAAEAELHGPDGSVCSIPLFWDGGDTWHLRFSPALPGRWRWSLRSPDAGLNGQAGEFECRPSARRGSLMPMPRAPHHFQYQNGEPVWFLGDTAWSLVTDVPEERHDGAAVTRYLERRAAQGFNVVHAMLLSEASDVWETEGKGQGAVQPGSVGCIMARFVLPQALGKAAAT
jgi:hypothetical protein